MIMRKEQTPRSWRKIEFGFELAQAGDVFEKDGGDNMGTALARF